MRNKCLSFVSVFSVVLLWASVYAVLAEAPKTPKIAFSSYQDGIQDIYLMNPDGTEWVNLTNDPARDIAPAWSPTGEHIIFSSDRDRFPGSWDLYLMDADGSNIRPVFDKSKDRSGGRWSPDGKQITYTTFEKGTVDGLYCINRRKKRGTGGTWRQWGLVPNWDEISDDGRLAQADADCDARPSNLQTKIRFPTRSPSVMDGRRYRMVPDKQ